MTMIDLRKPLRFAGYEPNVDVELHNDPQYDIGTLQRMNVRAKSASQYQFYYSLPNTRIITKCDTIIVEK